MSKYKSTNITQKRDKYEISKNRKNKYNKVKNRIRKYGYLATFRNSC